VGVVEQSDSGEPRVVLVSNVPYHHIFRRRILKRHKLKLDLFFLQRMEDPKRTDPKIAYEILEQIGSGYVPSLLEKDKQPHLSQGDIGHLSRD
jgi:hypothetical protein